MKTIVRIARTELQVLFYSPVAWLILVVFGFQATIVYTGILDNFVLSQALGWKLYNATATTFGGWEGLFTIMQTYLYLYIPLLTMNCMSREYASGSIKLLFSSPLTNYQIIFGKYLSLVIYCLALILVLGVFATYSIFTMDQVDIPLIASGLLGLFLLACAYAAVGLFMSSLTTYAVVAAMGTLAIFALLSYVKGMWQDIEFVRDITYWLAISGRSDTFIAGLLTSEDILYFIVVIALFLGLTIIKLQAGRQKAAWWVNATKYMAVAGVAMLIGYCSSLPQYKSFYDATRTKMNTLTKSSQEVVKQLKGGLTIHTYVNMLDPNYHHGTPYMYKYEVDRFKQYLRFKPDIKLQYHYYYHTTVNPHLDKTYPTLNEQQRFDTLRKLNNWTFEVVPYKELTHEADLASEGFRFVRLLERASGEKTYLRIYNDMYVHPSEAEISAAFKRLTIALPVVGFVTGHGERGSNAEQDRGYNMVAQEKTFRYALVNQGFNFENVDLSKPVAPSIRILVLADPRQAISAAEKANLDAYIQRGGNLLLAGEPGKTDIVNAVAADFGVRFLPGMLVKPTEKLQPDLLTLKPSQVAADFSHHLDVMKKRNLVLTMPSASALEADTTKGFNVITLFSSDSSGSWNELESTDLVDDSARLNTAAGEEEKSYPTVLALSRKIHNKEQRILLTGDADWLSNAELAMTRNDVNANNFSLISAAFYWLSEEEVPINMTRETPPDRSFNVGKDGWAIAKPFLKWVFPIALVLMGTLILIRRKRK